MQGVFPHQNLHQPHILTPLSYTYSYLLLYLGNQTLVPPHPPQHCHWCQELKNTLIADFLVAKATLETAGHCHWVSDLWFSPWPISQNWGNQSRNFKNKNSSSVTRSFCISHNQIWPCQCWRSILLLPSVWVRRFSAAIKNEWQRCNRITNLAMTVSVSSSLSFYF